MTFGFYVKATLQMQVPTKSKFKLSLSNTACINTAIEQQKPMQF